MTTTATLPDVHAGEDPPAEGRTVGERSAGQRWRSIPRRWRVVMVVLAAMAGVDALAAVAGSLGQGGTQSASGTSSSFDSSSTGTQAMAELLEHFGHPVRRLEEPLAGGAVPASATLVVADPVTWGASQSAALSAFVRAGGHAVLAGGPFSSADLRTILGTSDVPELSPVGVAIARAVGHSPEVAGVSVVDADPSGGAWDVAGSTVPILRNGGASLAVAADVGAGRVVLVASASVVQNGYLDRADNAAFALDLAGGPGRAVVFDEYAHGFGSTGVGALPLRWRWALVLAAVAAAVWVWSASRRFGPPETAERDLPPARLGYVDGLATVLAATDASQLAAALTPLGRATRSSLCRALGVPDDAGDEAVVRAASAAGVPHEVVQAALVAPSDRDGALAVGRAHAFLTRQRRTQQ